MFSFVHDLHEPTVFDRRGDIIIIPGYAVYVRRVLRVAASSEAFMEREGGRTCDYLILLVFACQGD